MFKEDSTKKLTILFNRFKPNTVSSQLTLAETFNGSEHFPSTVMVIKQGTELPKISLLNRKDKPDASSNLAATGISTDTRKIFALLSIFDARLSHITRYLSFSNKLSSVSLSTSPRWSVKVQLYNYKKSSQAYQNMTNDTKDNRIHAGNKTLRKIIFRLRKITLSSINKRPPPCILEHSW